MYTCPNCGGNLIFHVEKQKMYCENCQYEADPCEVQEFHPAEEEQTGEYEVTVFRCPQCGGEIISEDTTAATFCSFCGAATVLESRIAKKRKPSYILPFRKTKEECRDAYAKVLKKAPFVPREYKKPENISRFRGIYMPYWDYQYVFSEPFRFVGTKTRQKLNYMYKDFYEINCDISMDYKGVYFDASSSFSDHLSEAIAPYPGKSGREFTPAYLSGFYADTSDVRAGVYKQDADKAVREDVRKKIDGNDILSKYEISSYHMEELEKTISGEAKLVLLPVWFLSFRNGDRVSYAVVNGQTGKVAAELPVDGKKYFGASVILSALIFLILNRTLILTPSALLSIAAVLAAGCMAVINVQMTNLIVKDTGQDDRGYVSAKLGLKRPSQKKKVEIVLPEITGVFLLLAIYWLLYGTQNLPKTETFQNWQLLVTTVLTVFLSRGIIWGKKKKTVHKNYFGNWKEKLPVLMKPLPGILVIAAVAFLHPVSDIWYYAGVLFSLAMSAFSFGDMIRYHNKLSSRKLPQFNRRGGDEND